MEPGYEVYEYSRRGAVADLQEVLRAGVKPDQFLAYDGSTALVIASRSGHGTCVQELLTFGASPELRTEDGSTVLHHAVSGGSTQAVMACLKAGVTVNEPNEDGVTPVILAAHYGKDEIVKVLFEAKADINASADGWGTALDSANGKAIEVLEQFGAKRSDGPVEQALAKGAERFGYGCFDTGENPNAIPDKAPAKDRKPTVGDHVKLRRSKPGLLKEGEVGEVLVDDGSDCVPLKVKVGDAHDYYDYHDVVVCEPPVELGPDSDRATIEGTLRYATSKLSATVKPSALGVTGLSVTPVGFGCHRLDGADSNKEALSLAIQLGCNLVDVAPNYTDGAAETAVGAVLGELIANKKIRRDEIVVMTKVGNVLGQQLQYADGVQNMTEVETGLMHCISPEWIEQEITRSLERLQLSCVDCLLLHCPEFETRSPEVTMDDVYLRLHSAFRHLESEVSRGRIAMYGISGAFYPLRPTEAEHLELEAVMQQLPVGHHFRVLQFPLNFAEAQVLWVSHTPRNGDGAALDRERAQVAPTLFEAARSYGLATLTNRPLDGIYKESHGVLRFSSLDCDVRSFSELQLDNCDMLEEKVTSLCKLGEAPYQAGDGACGQLAAKTIKVLAGLKDVDCVLLGMRRPEYVITTLPLLFGSQHVPADVASNAVRAVHNTVTMWYATAIHEADHGTSKHWRLPVDQKGIKGNREVNQTSIGA